MEYSIIVLLLSTFLGFSHSDQEIWEKDMSNEVYIEGSTEGFEKVRVTCDSAKKSLTVSVVLSDPDFAGIFYTRGSFKAAAPPCYFDAPDAGLGEVSLTLPLEDGGECKTNFDEKANGGRWTNTVILQHDDWLIFPGDAAFEVACERVVEGSEALRAYISLADPDPGAKELPKHRKSTVSEIGEVEFTPNDIRPKKKGKKGGKKSVKRVKKDEL